MKLSEIFWCAANEELASPDNKFADFKAGKTAGIWLSLRMAMTNDPDWDVHDSIVHTIIKNSGYDSYNDYSLEEKYMFLMFMYYMQKDLEEIE